MKEKEYVLEIGGKKIVAFFSDLADQANGSVILKSEGTVVMAIHLTDPPIESSPLGSEWLQF